MHLFKYKKAKPVKLTRHQFEQKMKADGFTQREIAAMQPQKKR